ncbi:hypothetical protein OSTOST_06627, partial [Ostertagia ostertagi]
MECRKMEQQPTADGNDCSGDTKTGVKTENGETAPKSRPKQNRRNRFGNRPRIKSDSEVPSKFRNYKQSERSHAKESSARDPFDPQEKSSTKAVEEGSTGDVGRNSNAPKDPGRGGKKGPFPKRRVFTKRRASDSNAEFQISELSFHAWLFSQCSLEEAFNFLADELMKFIRSKKDSESHCGEHKVKDERHDTTEKSGAVNRSRHESETKTEPENHNSERRDGRKVRGMKSDMLSDHDLKLSKKGKKKPFKKESGRNEFAFAGQRSALCHEFFVAAESIGIMLHMMEKEQWNLVRTHPWIRAIPSSVRTTTQLTWSNRKEEIAGNEEIAIDGSKESRDRIGLNHMLFHLRLMWVPMPPSSTTCFGQQIFQMTRKKLLVRDTILIVMEAVEKVDGTAVVVRVIPERGSK